MLGKCEQVLSLIPFLSMNPCKFCMYILTNFCLNQFFMELMKVPRVEAKLRVFAFKITFTAQVWYLGYRYLCLVLHATAVIKTKTYA
jgi:hypothetical protein